METKQELLTLNGKEYILDIEQAKKLGLLKEKYGRVRSWEEFKRKYPNKFFHFTSDQLTTHEEKALEAFSKLLKLRRDWIGKWEPKCDTNNYFIFYSQYNKSFLIDWFSQNNRSLSFPTNKMAKEFLETFRGLIEEAKILI